MSSDTGFVGIFDKWWTQPSLKAKDYDGYRLNARGRYYYERSKQRALVAGREVLVLTGEIGKISGVTFISVERV